MWIGMDAGLLLAAVKLMAKRIKLCRWTREKPASDIVEKNDPACSLGRSRH